MTPKSDDRTQTNDERPPDGISNRDWTKTPVAVREFINSILNSNQQQGTRPENYESKWPTWVMVLANLAAVVVISLLLADKIALQCIAPRQVSELSAATILLIVLHLIWRAVRIPDPSNIKVNLGCVQFPVTVAITIFNEIHPWKLSSRLLVFLLVVFLMVGSFLNLTPHSPFHRGGELFAIPSFEVQRLNSQSPERLAPGATLTINTGEKVFIELVLLGETQVSCTWFTTSSNANTGQGCSILLDVPSLVKRDILTVFVQPVCGTRKESVSLNVVVQP